MLKEEEEHDDLSPYERLRLERIRRNEARLVELGLDHPLLTKVSKEDKSSTTLVSETKKSRKRRHQREATPAPTRCSKRIKQRQEQQLQAKEDAGAFPTAAQDGKEKEEKDHDLFELKIDYSQWPQEPYELDDDEFKVFVNLRKWRLRRKNELDVETYKICQNRTMCEMIRRMRNDPSWGRFVMTAKKEEQKKKKSVDDVTSDLIQCWGIGPSKAAPGGFGPEMIEVLEHENNQRWLAASRLRDQPQ